MKKVKTNESTELVHQVTESNIQWDDLAVRQIVIDEVDGQWSLLIHIPGYLKSIVIHQKELFSSEVRKFVEKEIPWSLHRVPFMNTVFPRDIQWFSKDGIGCAVHTFGSLGDD